MAAIPDPESKERVPSILTLPRTGAQVHFEYTVHAHFRMLKSILGDVGKVRFYMDQDDTMRPISTPSNDGRVWRGYRPYNPRRVQQILDIYRTYYTSRRWGRMA